MTILFILASIAGSIRLFTLCYHKTLLWHRLIKHRRIKELYIKITQSISRNSSEVINGIITKTSTVISGVITPIRSLISSIIILIGIVGVCVQLILLLPLYLWVLGCFIFEVTVYKI